MEGPPSNKIGILMRSKLTTLLTVIGAVTVLVLAANTVARATTGKAILAGKINKATKMTSITRTTPGTGLQVKTKSAANAPLAVNGKGKVVNLNADTVDGLDSAALQQRSYAFVAEKVTAKNRVEYTLPVPNGSYLVTYSNYFAELTGAGGIQCFLYQDNATGPDVNTGYSSIVDPDSNSWGPALSGTGLVTKSATSQIYVNCSLENLNKFSTEDVAPMRIVVTPTKVVSTKVIKANPPVARQR